MRLVPLLALASVPSIFCGPLPSGAQSTAGHVQDKSAQAATAVVVEAPNSAGCPVAFQARHASDGGLVQVSPGQKKRNEWYQLTLSSLHGAGIAQARVTLHGIAGAHVIPAGGSSNLPDATESFNLSPANNAKPHLLRSTVYAERLTGVQWIELNELTYSDGTQWKESDTAVCRITPNGFMLVGDAGAKSR